MGEPLQETERPGHRILIRAQCSQTLHIRFFQLRQPSAAHRLHDPDGDIPFL